MNQNELNQKFMVFEQQIRQFQEQQQAVEQAISDIGHIGIGLNDLIGKVGSEIMAPIGKGIFVKAKLLSEDLTVDIGGGNFVKKTIPQTKEMLDIQIEKLKGMSGQINAELEKINQEITKVMMESQEQNSIESPKKE